MPNQNEPQPRNQTSYIRSLGSSFGGLTRFIDTAWAKMQNLTLTNYNLACRMVARGDIDDAIRRFKITLWLSPDHVPSLYNLACLYKHTGQTKLALDHFVKILRKQPNHENALYMICSINPDMIRPELRPQRLPPLIALEYFDALAKQYDLQQQQRQYRMPVMVHQMLHPELDPTKKHDLMDLGCGTGLCGIQFRGEFTNIVGVDISNRMLDEAYRRLDDRGVKIYTRLVHQDLHLALREWKPESVDVALCISVFAYVGNLHWLFEAVAKVLREGGLFACSFDPFAQRNTYGMMPRTGYFGHDVNYVVAQAQRVGLEVVRTGEVAGYPNQPVELCIFRKVAGGKSTTHSFETEAEEGPIQSPFGIAPTHDDTPPSGGQ